MERFTGAERPVQIHNRARRIELRAATMCALIPGGVLLARCSECSAQRLRVDGYYSPELS